MYHKCTTRRKSFVAWGTLIGSGWWIIVGHGWLVLFYDCIVMKTVMPLWWIWADRSYYAWFGVNAGEKWRQKYMLVPKNEKSEKRRCDRWCYWYKLYLHNWESIQFRNVLIKLNLNEFKMSSRWPIPLHQLNSTIERWSTMTWQMIIVHNSIVSNQWMSFINNEYCNEWTQCQCRQRCTDWAS